MKKNYFCSINRKAALVCVGEGTEAIGEFFASCRFDVR